MNEVEHRVLIGACGWEHRGWNGGFYPEDLPADWRLGYYANAFRVVLIPGDHGLDASRAARLRADSGEPFWFVAEAPSAALERAAAGDWAPLHRFADGVQALGESCAGVLLAPPPALLGAPAELRRALALLHAVPLSIDLPCRAAMPDPADSPLAPLGRVWHGPDEPPALAAGRLALARVSVPAPSPRLLRTLLETCLAAAAPGRRAVLLLDGNPPDPAGLEQALVLLDLL